MDRILPLENPVLDYAWGSRKALARLQGRPAPAPGPEAELWIGAHSSAPSRVVLGSERVPLDTWIARDPLRALGASVVRRFGDELPFLLKVLAVAEPLSLQAHPGARQARAGFAREEASGVPRADPRRSYRDDRPKAELVCALDGLESFAGFRAPAEILERFERLELATLRRVLAPLQARTDAEGWRAAFVALLAMEPQELAGAVEAAARSAERAAHADPGLAWVPRLAEAYPGDPGALAPIYLNHLSLAPDEALYVAPGMLHSHLAGTVVEVMTSSDNVLRCGLTPKHVDVPGLLEVVDFAALGAKVVSGDGASPEYVYPAPCDAFRLTRLRGTGVRPLPAGVALLLCSEGALRLRASAGGAAVALAAGEAAFVPAAAGACTLEGQGTAWRVAVPPPPDA